MFFGHRHPTWVPLLGEVHALHAGHHRLDESVRLINNRVDGAGWLAAITAKLLDVEDVNNASAAMAEIRAFGGLIEAGFDINPVVETETPTPDFIATTEDQKVAFEVAAKHQDREQDELQGQIHDAMHGNGLIPEGVEHNVYRGRRGSIEMFVSEHQPGGKPNPEKPNDSVQTNLISRVCAIKGRERQIPDDKAAVLVVDFNDFGGPLTPHTLVDQTVPATSGRDGFTSGALWYAFYGWKGAPVFEGDERVRMEHDGRFRLAGEQKSKLSAALIVLPEHVVCFENPEAAFPLAESTRLRLARFPWFDLKHSMLGWRRGDVEKQLELHVGLIGRLDARFDALRWV
ncbi:MAG: hypothetical protein OXI22_03940 [Defluviicoccus sp.]|nr:hypothetical protein [Defluviicoccus sp.]